MFSVAVFSVDFSVVVFFVEYFVLFAAFLFDIEEDDYVQNVVFMFDICCYHHVVDAVEFVYTALFVVGDDLDTRQDVYQVDEVE